MPKRTVPLADTRQIRIGIPYKLKENFFSVIPEGENYTTILRDLISYYVVSRWRLIREDPYLRNVHDAESVKEAALATIEKGRAAE